MSLRVIEWASIPSDRETGKDRVCESAMTLGVFDGVHLGHQELIRRVVDKGPAPTVITFRENPKKVISPDNYKGDIYSLRQKLAAIEKLGVRQVILIDFSPEFSKLEGREFFNLLGSRVKISFFAIGSNFRCGYKQDTDAVLIGKINESKGIPTEIIPQVCTSAGLVSSSRIRDAIFGGNLVFAAGMLGRPLELDLADIPEQEHRNGLFYDFQSAQRIIPEKGSYPVLLNPGSVRVHAYAEDGKIFLPDKHTGESFESIEFI